MRRPGVMRRPSTHVDGAEPSRLAGQRAAESTCGRHASPLHSPRRGAAPSRPWASALTQATRLRHSRPANAPQPAERRVRAAFTSFALAQRDASPTHSEPTALHTGTAPPRSQSERHASPLHPPRCGAAPSRPWASALTQATRLRHSRPPNAPQPAQRRVRAASNSFALVQRDASPTHSEPTALHTSTGSTRVRTGRPPAPAGPSLAA